MYKIYFFLIIIFCGFLQAKELTFDEFASANFFAPIDESYLKLTAKCRKNFDDNGKKKAFEVILYNKDKHIFDLNKHYSSHHKGHKSKIYNTSPFKNFTN